MPVSWNAPVKISEAAKAGYTIVVPAFLDVKENTDPVKLY